MNIKYIKELIKIKNEYHSKLKLLEKKRVEEEVEEVEVEVEVEVEEVNS